MVCQLNKRCVDSCQGRLNLKNSEVRSLLFLITLAKHNDTLELRCEYSWEGVYLGDCPRCLYVNVCMLLTIEILESSIISYNLILRFCTLLVYWKSSNIL